MAFVSQRYEERVIIISSKENEGGVTDAEKALLQIAALILAVILPIIAC